MRRIFEADSDGVWIGEIGGWDDFDHYEYTISILDKTDCNEQFKNVLIDDAFTRRFSQRSIHLLIGCSFE